MLSRILSWFGPTREDRDYVRAIYEDAMRNSHEIAAKGEDIGRRMDHLAGRDREALAKLRNKRRELERAGRNPIDVFVDMMRNGDRNGDET